MSDLGDELAPVALELIGEFGLTVTYTKVTHGTRNLTTGKSTITASSSAIKALVEDYKGYDYSSGLIQQGDLKVSIAAQALALPPVLGDKVTIRAVVHSVVGVKTFNAGESAVVYVLQVRAS